MLNHLSDETLFWEATEEFRHHAGSCPRCGAAGKLSPYGAYSRWLVCLNNEAVLAARVKPLRFACASCGATHALLPDILVPYSPYSLRFKLTVLTAYFERASTVVAISERFHVAVSTIYAWKKLFLSHRELFLGILMSRKESALTFLRRLSAAVWPPECLQEFFRRYAFSFLQLAPVPTAQRLPP
jgi:ribosomal protein S27AE